MSPGKGERPLPPDIEQRRLIVEELGRNMLVEAAAGTGKTASIVGRMVALLARGECSDIRTMAAVTFTRKAAAELRARFRVALESAVRDAEGVERERLSTALASIEQCFTGTIHSFCGRLLRERPVEAGIDIAFEEIEEETDAVIRTEAWREYCAGLIAGVPGGTLEGLAEVGLQLTDLEDAFKAFAIYPDVGRWPVPSARDLAILTDEAIPALGDYVAHMLRLSTDLPRAYGNDTLIQSYLRIPRVVSHYDDLRDPRQLTEILGDQFDRSVRLVQKEWAKEGKLTKDDGKAEELRWNTFREEVVRPVMRAWREARYAPAMRALEEARGLYDKRRAERGQLNFQDLLMKSAALLRDNPHVRRYFRSRFTHLLVDEFQDTDPIQAEVMLLLTASDFDETDWRRCTPRPGSLFVVGDPKQSIYRFRRADIVTYNEVRDIILGGDAADDMGMLVHLSANFRAVEPVIGWVNSVFQPDSTTGFIDDTGDMLRFPAEGSGESPPYVALKKGRQDGNAGELSGIYSLTIPEGAGNKDPATEYEADLIARFIRSAIDSGVTVSRTTDQLQDGRSEQVDPSDFMIITLSTAGLSTYARKLQEYGIPHQVTGGTALNEVEELGLLLLCLKAVARPDDPVALVAVLRSPLIGVSDAALYRFKKADGHFNYNASLPEDLEPEDARVFDDAFARLRRYHSWLSRLPAVSAIENIVADLGLLALASARPGGDVQAGSLGKALELVRRAQHDVWTTVQLVDYLEQIVAAEEKYDGVSARSDEVPRVRVMNLHKVKGLEAPVVFLANAYGESSHEVDLFVDRSGGSVLGFMAIYGPPRGWAKGPLLAHPDDWDALAAREDTFRAAERLRLRYVAATRAGSAMSITRRVPAGKNTNNAWKYFGPHISADRSVEDPGEQSPPVLEKKAISIDMAESAARAITERLLAAERPTHEVSPAKAYALAASGERAPAGRSGPDRSPPVQGETGVEGEFGVEWGQAIHELLELAMLHPDADLLAWAQTILAENDIDPAHAASALETVSSVTDSDIWRRALNSPMRLTEVPFEMVLEDVDPPTLVRGAIDLVFSENGGWVLVDYKTDRVATAEGVELLAKTYSPQLDLYSLAWERCTGESVKEAGLYLTREQTFVTVRQEGSPPGRR